MAIASKKRNMFEGLVKDGSFKWLTNNRSSYDYDSEESVQRSWIQELSPIANKVVRKCSKILDVSASELQERFNHEASEPIKQPSHYARNFLEFCCFGALARLTKVVGHLGDKKFRYLTYDMMLAWEAPAAASQSLSNVDDDSSEDASVGVESFSRIAPAAPIIANVIIAENLFEVLTSSTCGRLKFSVYEKYITGLDRAVKKLKSQSESSLLSSVRAARGEKILEVDGTVTSQPVLEHVGISAWPGRLILTDHALYFEPFRVVSYDKPKKYDLSDDLNQIVKPELTGPWGTRLFDKAVLYKSISLSEPVVIEFPELKGHTRRDYWLAIILEVLSVHRFINKFQITGTGRNEALSRAILGILRLQAIREVSSANSLCYEAHLMFNLCEKLPGGDLILETLADILNMWESENQSKVGEGMYSISALTAISSLGFAFGKSSSNTNGALPLVGEVAVGQMTYLEKAIKTSKDDYKKVVVAQATVDGVKVDGLDTNLAVMKELVSPVTELGKFLLQLAYWEDPVKSLLFCLVFSYIIYRGWLGYAFAFMLISFAVFLVLNRYSNQGRPVDKIKVLAPPPMNTVEQLLAVQNAISQVEALVQDGNIVLLKMRGLFLSIFPQASEKFAVALLLTALVLALLPSKYVILLAFLETFTRYSPPRKANTERWTRRMKEWWFSIPAAPVDLEREDEDKKKK